MHGVLMSFHTPYFISLSGVDPEKRLKSIDYISRSLHAAELLCADTIVIHAGSAAKITRVTEIFQKACQLDALADIRHAQLAAGMGAMRILIAHENQLQTVIYGMYITNSFYFFEKILNP